MQSCILLSSSLVPPFDRPLLRGGDQRGGAALGDDAGALDVPRIGSV